MNLVCWQEGAGVRQVFGEQIEPILARCQTESQKTGFIRRTKHLPSLTKAFPVICIYHVDECMAVIVILGPNAANAPLTAKVPELNDR